MVGRHVVNFPFPVTAREPVQVKVSLDTTPDETKTEHRNLSIHSVLLEGVETLG